MNKILNAAIARLAVTATVAPKFIVAKDYHIFYQKEQTLRKRDPKMRVVEISLEDYGWEFRGVYYGMIYQAGQKPLDRDIKLLLAKKGKREGWAPVSKD